MTEILCVDKEIQSKYKHIIILVGHFKATNLVIITVQIRTYIYDAHKQTNFNQKHDIQQYNLMIQTQGNINRKLL